MTKDKRVQKWRALIAEQAASGLSKKAFCEQRDIHPSNFYYWTRRLSDQIDSEALGFRQFQPAIEHEVELCFSGKELRLRSHSISTLAQIIEHLDCA